MARRKGHHDNLKEWERRSHKITGVVIWERYGPVIRRWRRGRQMKGACEFGIDHVVVRAAREGWRVCHNRLRDKVLGVWVPLVRLKTVLETQAATGSGSRWEVTAWVISTVRLEWIVCHGKKLLYLTIEFSVILLVGRLECPGRRKMRGGQVYRVLRSRDTWLRHGIGYLMGLDAIVTAISLRIYR